MGPDAKGVYGGGRGIRVTDIEPGRFRKELEALKPEARGRALAKLETMQFHRNDLASLHVDPAGDVYYVCAFSEPSATTTSTVLASSPGTLAAVPISSPPAYSSKPGSPNTLYLDFNGHVITNTAWNTANGIARWDCKPFDTDGNTNSFSDLEQRYIHELWQRVAEDYAPFDVNVTTVEPVTWNARVGHALITPDTDASGQTCPHSGSGGIAYVGVFGDPSYSYNASGCYSPAWVLPMGNSSSSYSETAEAAAHELGHNLGLSHDGTTSLEYYGGHAGTASAPSWGPIMGTGYGRDVSQWSQGEYYLANQTQDDLAIIAANLQYKADDHGGDAASSSPLSLVGTSASVTGVIERTGDIDVFRFASGAGAASFAARPARITNGTWGGNADLALVLADSAGNTIASNNPAAAVTSGVAAVLSKGLYYLTVKPVAAGTPSNSTPSGYTIYGSLGAYGVTGTVAALGDSVVVVSPNGGETAYPSNTLAIQWASGFTNAVNIDLYRAGYFHSAIAAGATNTGAYNWLVPTNLGVASDYRIRISKSGVSTNFDEGDAAFSVALKILTPLDEKFDTSGSLPAGWSHQVVSGNASWRFQGGGYGGYVPAAAYSGTNNATLYYTSTADNRARLITPSLSLANATGGVLRFQHCMAAWSGDQDFLNVYYRTNAAADWVILASYSNSVDLWTARQIALPALSGSYYVSFEGNAKYGYGVCLDDVSVQAYAVPSGQADYDGDLLPDLWEQQYFGGATNAQVNAPASNGCNTLIESYVAGLDPTNPASFFQLNVTNDGSNLIFAWQPRATGRVYALGIATNLMAGFTNLAVALPATQAAYTSPVATGAVYRMDVRLQ